MTKGVDFKTKTVQDTFDLLKVAYRMSCQGGDMLIAAVAIVFALIVAGVLWRTGATQIPREMRESFSPQDLEVLQEDLNFRKLVGQIVVISIAFILIFWLIL
jgi:hypothetical protein